jgi:hypothetical protein
LSFQAAPTADGTTVLQFGDSPVVREAVSATASTVPCQFSGADVILGEPPVLGPTLGIMGSGNSVVLFWPSSATGFDLFAADSPRDSQWTKVATAPVEIAGQKIITLPTAGARKYYRLQKQ